MTIFITELLLTMFLVMIVAYNMNDISNHPPFLSHFSGQIGNICDQNRKPYLNKCFDYYKTASNQSDAVFNKFFTTTGDFETYQWINQYNNIKDT